MVASKYSYCVVKGLAVTRQMMVHSASVEPVPTHIIGNYITPYYIIHYIPLSINMVSCYIYICFCARASACCFFDNLHRNRCTVTLTVVFKYITYIYLVFKYNKYIWYQL